MPLLKIKCPSCGTEGSISFVEGDYEGPYTCWKCHALSSIRIQRGRLESCQPLSQEEWQRQQQAEALKAKFKRRSLDKTE